MRKQYHRFLISWIIEIHAESDGTYGAARTMPSASYWNSVAYGNGIFVFTGFGPEAAASSP